MTNEQIGEIAANISDWLQSACVDMSDCVESSPDEMYDDVDTLCDLTGDRIFDDCKQDYKDMIRVAFEIKAYAHDSLKEAMDYHITRWTSYLKK